MKNYSKPEVFVESLCAEKSIATSGGVYEGPSVGTPDGANPVETELSNNWWGELLGGDD